MMGMPTDAVVGPSGLAKIVDEAGLTIARLNDFWTWAFDDLRDNTLRGVFAEFIVSKALGVAKPLPRAGWADFDVLTDSGIRVEVKSAANVQSWQSKRSPSMFGGLRGQSLTPDGSQYVGERAVRADVFVFAYQTDIDPLNYDALAMDRWEFYVVAGSRIDALNQRSIRLTVVRSLARPVTFSAMAAAVEAAADENKKSRFELALQATPLTISPVVVVPAFDDLDPLVAASADPAVDEAMLAGDSAGPPAGEFPA